MKKIIKSSLMIVAAAAIVVGATMSFFSDEEKSEGNTFTAGAIDLGIDNTSYYNGLENPGTTWLMTYDLNDLQGPGQDGKYFFFDFADLKPGDWGEDTISVHVNSNPAWACAEITLTSDDDNDCTDPELADDQDPDCDVANTDPFDGDLGDNLQFAWWPDDGDNVLETDEVNDVFFLSPLSAAQLFEENTVYLTLADSYKNFFGEVDDTGAPLPLDPEKTYYIGKAWCFGQFDELAATAVAEDQGVDPTVDPGVACNGELVDNKSQTDSLTADLAFNATQARNNEQFECQDSFRTQ